MLSFTWIPFFHLRNFFAASSVIQYFPDMIQCPIVHWASWRTTQDALVCDTHGRELSFSLKSCRLKSTHSQKVTWVKTLEVFLSSLALIGVQAARGLGAWGKGKYPLPDQLGITQLHIIAGCKYCLSHYSNYAVAPKSAYPNKSERS